MRIAWSRRSKSPKYKSYMVKPTCALVMKLTHVHVKVDVAMVNKPLVVSPTVHSISNYLLILGTIIMPKFLRNYCADVYVVSISLYYTSEINNL